ncbi:MAG: metallophosphoesterase [Myxococcales bacterium]|nr:metallophosphoesterase [Myxococcales bacterium]
MVLRLLLGASVSALLHFYVWRRIVDRSEVARGARWAITAVMLAMFVAIPLTTSSRMWAPGLASTLGWISMPWMAFVGLLAIVLLAIDLARAFARLGRKALLKPGPGETAVSRRKFLARVTGGAAVTVAGASVTAGMISARGVHEVVDVEIRLAKLPRALDGFTIVQLSDLHVGMTIDRSFVERVVAQANRLSPDLIALTGDLIDGRVEDLRDDVAPLGDLRAKHGVFAVTGNHEYYAGADPWIAEISRLGARYLRNERVTIGSGEASFDLAGVDDHTAESYPGHGEDLRAATAGRDPNRALVLLAHQPRQVRRAAKHGVDLQLSGHTHGGQIWPWHFIVRLQQGGLLAGRYQYEATQLYVTRGCGYWGPPVRLFAPLEITRLILRSA